MVLLPFRKNLREVDGVVVHAVAVLGQVDFLSVNGDLNGARSVGDEAQLSRDVEGLLGRPRYRLGDGCRARIALVDLDVDARTRRDFVGEGGLRRRDGGLLGLGVCVRGALGVALRLLVRRVRQARDGYGRRFLSGLGFFTAEHEHADDNDDHGDDADADEQWKLRALMRYVLRRRVEVGILWASRRERSARRVHMVVSASSSTRVMSIVEHEASR